MGSNDSNQLGIKLPKSSIPIQLKDINQITKIRAGSFSIALSKDSVYIWGQGTFGSFETPHKMKGLKAEVIDS
jgi:alpha-tubulin suppressor-like RCC1 family protein